jgi:hypothetical protein
LPDWRLKPEATHLKIRAADGFYEVVPLAVIKADERVMLAYAWDGVPLPTEHGFPLRIYIPNVYGMKQPKWIESIEATDRWEPGYWVERGWDRYDEGYVRDRHHSCDTMARRPTRERSWIGVSARVRAAEGRSSGGWRRWRARGAPLSPTCGFAPRLPRRLTHPHGGATATSHRSSTKPCAAGRASGVHRTVMSQGVIYAAPRHFQWNRPDDSPP